MPSPPSGTYWRTFKGNIDGSCLPSDKEFVLIQLQGNPIELGFAHFRDEVRRALSRLTVKIEYTDIYNRKMPILQTDLENGLLDMVLSKTRAYKASIKASN